MEKNQEKVFSEKAIELLKQKYNTNKVNCIDCDNSKAIFEINNNLEAIIYFDDKNLNIEKNSKNIKQIQIDDKNYTIVCNDIIILSVEALKKKYNTDNVKYLASGWEGRTYIVGDKNLIKIYKGENQSLHIARQNDEFFKIIDGTIKPKESDNINVGGKNLLLQRSNYAKNGALDKIIYDKNFNRSASFPFAFWLSLDLLYMHRIGFAHLDLRPDNAVVNGKGKPKIIDCTCGKPIGDNSVIYGRGLNFGFSPDFYKNEIIDENGRIIGVKEEELTPIKVSGKQDVCSLGFMFIDLFFDNNTFFKDIKSHELMVPGKNVCDVMSEYNQQVIEKIHKFKDNKELRDKEIFFFGSDESKLKLLDLIESMINPTTELRPSSEEVVKKIAEIYPDVSKNYEKFTINGNEYNFGIKEKEKLFSGIVKASEVNLDEEKIAKIEQKIRKNLGYILDFNKVSKECKQNLSDYDFLENRVENLSSDEQILLDGIAKNINLLEQVRNSNEVRGEILFEKENLKRVFC